MGFSNRYFFALLCVKLTVCGPVAVNNLVQIYEKGVNHDCKVFPIPKNDTALFELCKLPVPDLKDEKQVNLDLKFSPVPLMCYSAMSNMMTLCPADASQELNLTEKIDIDLKSVSVGNFCVEAAKVSVKHCEEVPKEDTSDCELLTKVSTILTSQKKCEKHCIEDEEIHPVCLYLYFSTQAVSFNFYEKKSENVVPKSTEKSVNPEIPLPPIQPKETKSSTTESQKKPDVKVTNGEKQDVDKGSTKGVDEKVEEELKKEDKNTNKANPTNPKSDEDISEKPGEATTAKNAGEKNGHAEPQTKVEKTDEVKKEPTLPVEAPNKTKPEQGISENTMKKDKSKSEDDSRSSFFSYFILLSIVAIVAYLVFHNKQKILALILEGRRRQGTRRRSGGREYRKLDSNLEDTMNTESFTSGQHVIY